MKTASIVTHNTPQQLLRSALESLCRSAVDIIYIVDNSPSHPAPPELPGNCQTRLEYITTANTGFGAAHNIAISKAAAAGADFHLVMNPDVRWEGDAISPLINYMQQHEDVALVMPRVEYPDGTLQYTARMLPTPLDLIFKRFLPRSLSKKRINRYLLADADHSKPFNSPYLLGSFMLFRMQPLMQIGGFDTRFFMYPEDIDITRRLHQHYQTLYLPLTTITHDHAAASRTSRKMLKIHIRNMIKYFNKWGWLLDSQRRRFNKELLQSLPRHPHGSAPEKGRG